jgi:UDP-N-acetylmuramoyl-tripeptide--D-alanyl-D-alanine ligase
MKLCIDEILKLKTFESSFPGDKTVLLQSLDGISTDSRTISPHDLFIALQGDKFDGHQFAFEVQNQKAIAAVVNKNWFDNNKSQGNFVVVNDTLLALQEISCYYRKKFTFPMLAITGSNGKTTTKEMITVVLSTKYEVLRNKGNLNNHIGVPLTLCQANDSDNMAVIEMGTNHFGEIKRLAEIAQPNYGLITNIGPAHLEFFGSLEGVAKAKTELWHYLEQNSGTAFVNVDDPLLAKNIPKSCKVISYGFEHKADYQGEYLGVDEGGCPRLRIKGDEIQLQVAGMHNSYNALSAIAVGLEFKVSFENIKNALATFLPASKRMEIIRNKDLIIINDSYNANPLSTEKALMTLAQMKTSGRRFAVLGDMRELGEQSEQFHRKIGEKAAELNIDFLFGFGEMSKHTVEGAKRRGLKEAIHFEDKKQLIEHLKNNIRQADIVLVKGSRGMAMEEVTAALSEKQI